MFENFNKSIMLLTFVLMFLVIIPTAFAEDNETVLEADIDAGSTDTVVLTAGEPNHYYFDASAQNDTGDGSAENPYKYLRDEYVRPNSVLHFAEGEYSFKQINSGNYNNITFIGQNSQNTIIRGQGSATIINRAVTLSDITIFNTTGNSKGIQYRVFKFNCTC